MPPAVEPVGRGLPDTHGTKGVKRLGGWGTDAYELEHVDLVNAIRRGLKLNDGWHSATSSFTAVLGRMATYSGLEVEWDEAVAKGPSELPARLAYDADPPDAARQRRQLPDPAAGHVQAVLTSSRDRWRAQARPLVAPASMWRPTECSARARANGLLPTRCTQATARSTALQPIDPPAAAIPAGRRGALRPSRSPPRQPHFLAILQFHGRALRVAGPQTIAVHSAGKPTTGPGAGTERTARELTCRR